MSPTVHPRIEDLGTMAYQPAWDYQLQVHDRVLSGEFADGAILLVEHPAVITYGRRMGSMAHLLAAPEILRDRNIELMETDRGGDITFHGPGQLVVYPIIPLNRYRLNLHSYMRLMEQVVIETLATFGIAGERSDGATGVWVQTPVAGLAGTAKVCAMGIKVRRWVTLHGLALNVTTDLSFFDLINPCGLGRPVTSMEKLLQRAPEMSQVRPRLVAAFVAELEQSLRN